MTPFFARPIPVLSVLSVSILNACGAASDDNAPLSASPRSTQLPSSPQDWADEAPPFQEITTKHWMKIGGAHSFLRREPTAANEGERGIDWCTLYTGTKFFLAQPPVRERDFLKIKLANPIPGCALSEDIAFVEESTLRDASGEFAFKRYENPKLKAALDSIFNAGNGKQTIWSVDIRASNHWSADRYIMYQRNPYTAVKPASNMKLMTTWAAFEKVPDARRPGSNRFDYIRHMMKTSDNGMANTVLGWAGGTSAVRKLFDLRGFVPSSTFHVADGSGLSYGNRLSATDIVQVLLWVIRDSGYIRSYRATLPVAGRDGTLRGRMGDLPGTVAAKTGTLNHTTALAGIADAGKTNWQVSFAILGDHVPAVWQAEDKVDRAMREVIRTINHL